MKVVFVGNTAESLGIEYLSAYLKRSGHEVFLVFDPLLFRDYFFSFPKLNHVFDMEETIIEEIVAQSPDVVLFSLVTGKFRWGLRLARRVKERIKTVVVFGGMHPTAAPESTMSHPEVDFVGVGECEEALEELLTCLECGRDPSGVLNFWGRARGGKVFSNPPRPLVQDLDNLLLPDKHLYFEKYRGLVSQCYLIGTSRGCLYNCSYCYVNQWRRLYPNQRFYRRRSVMDVIGELRWAVSEFQIKSIRFVDDVFWGDERLLQEFLDAYKSEINLPFRCEMSPQMLTPEVVKMLEGANCATVNMGVQTISERIKKEVLFRHETNDSVQSAIGAFRDSSVRLLANIILGLPGQDERELLEIARFFNENKVYVVLIFSLLFFPGAEIVEKARECGLLDQEAVERLEMEPEDINTISEAGRLLSPAWQAHASLIMLSPYLPKKFFLFLSQKRRFLKIPGFMERFLCFYFLGLVPLTRTIFKRGKKGPSYWPLSPLLYYLFFLRRWTASRLKSAWRKKGFMFGRGASPKAVNFKP